MIIMGKQIQLITLTSNGEKALRQYITETQKTSYKGVSKAKMWMTRKFVNQFTVEEYFEEPLRLVISIKQAYAHLVLDYGKIRRNLNKIMEKYGALESDYNIEIISEEQEDIIEEKPLTEEMDNILQTLVLGVKENERETTTQV